ncbi:MAG: aldehyde ferredoxin oxidoreductase [Dehalococcoidia bacterium]|nr:MAG: aldehyde ferredoxin oxidoreductase [Dehalococcoidia bacterium]
MSYRWKVLRVNLSNGSVDTEPLNKEWTEKYFGGRGLGAKYLYEELKGGVEPLSPANKLILTTGPFTGTIVPCSGKLAITTKSPATGGLLDCSIGGHFASQLKFAGYDVLIIEGQAKGPVYLLIEDDKVEIRKANHLWSKGIFETESKLNEEHGVNARILSIGPAGENLVPFACIGSELYRQAGRGGVGSVMGSKKLKAIVCSGSKSVSVPDMPRLLKLIKKAIAEDVLTDTNLWAHTEGTPAIVEMSNSAGTFPTRNYQDGVFAGAKKINSDSIQRQKPKKKACFACALGCGNYTAIKGSAVEGPEYETLAVAGANCGVDDLEAIIKFNAECDDLGLDTISTGNVLGFAMEMTERGIKDFGIRFGDIKNYLKLPQLIVQRQGVGAELSQGVKKLAKKYGTADFAMEVKGLELPGYDPRGSWAMGLAYATASRGGCHMSAWPIADEAFGDIDPFTIEGKAKLVIDGQHYNAIKFSLIVCDFWALSLETMSELLSCVLGREIPVAELEKAAERIWNTFRLFNVREGFKAADDTLPARFFNDPLKSGTPAGRVLPRDQFDSMLKEYYQLRGWDSNGMPTQKKLKELAV